MQIHKMNSPSESFASLSGFKQGTGYVWPTPEQQWMLRAAILPGQAGRDAWQNWIATADIDHLDAGSFRMIPLLYRNLKRIGIEHELLGRFRGIHHRAWYENQMALHKLSQLLRTFHEADVPTLILKGAALALLYYKDLGLRPMADLDVLVPVNKAADVIGRLRDAGWRSVEALPRRITEDYLLAVKACNMIRNESDPKLDLHWHVFQECLEPESDLDLWERSVPVRCGEVASRALSPADQFLHTCAHAMEWNAIAPMRWVSDAMAVLSAVPDFDWDRVLHQAGRRRLVLTLQSMLPYLRRLVDAPIPDPVMEQLQNLPVTPIELDWMKIRTRGISQLTVFDLFKVRAGLYKRSALSARFHPAALGFPLYMQLVWGMDHWWEVPMRGARTIWNRVSAAK
jgi:hypothetical protein